MFNGAILQQTFVVDYVVENNMCPDCNRQNANPNSWIACVQVCVGEVLDRIGRGRGEGASPSEPNPMQRSEKESGGWGRVGWARGVVVCGCGGGAGWIVFLQ